MLNIICRFQFEKSSKSNSYFYYTAGYNNKPYFHVCLFKNAKKEFVSDEEL